MSTRTDRSLGGRGGLGRLGTLLTLGLLVGPAEPAAAQDAPAAGSAGAAAGSWNVRWAQAVRVQPDGSVEIQRWGDALLELAQEADSVHGTWTTEVLERVQWRVRGTYREGVLRLEATEHDSTNQELAIVERIEWRATVDGDSLEGTVAMVIGGRARAPARRPFSAERAPPG